MAFKPQAVAAFAVCTFGLVREIPHSQIERRSQVRDLLKRFVLSGRPTFSGRSCVPNLSSSVLVQSESLPHRGASEVLAIQCARSITELDVQC